MPEPRVTCPDCDGTGLWLDKLMDERSLCNECYGSGTIPKSLFDWLTTVRTDK